MSQITCATCRPSAEIGRVDGADSEPRAKKPTARMERVGRQQAPVIVIENFHPDPHSLVVEAQTSGKFSATSKLYPGVRSTGTLQYVKLVCQRLRCLFPALF